MDGFPVSMLEVLRKNCSKNPTDKMSTTVKMIARNSNPVRTWDLENERRREATRTTMGVNASLDSAMIFEKRFKKVFLKKRKPFQRGARTEIKEI